MSGNTFGTLFRLTSFGESHGAGVGGVIDGCPAGLPLTESTIQKELDLRRPGGLIGGVQTVASTTRKEPDTVRLLSGVFEGLTTGTSIGFLVENTNQRSTDYGAIAQYYRPGHADYTYDAKYGVRDFRGGGRSSGRETIARVAGGAIAQVLLAQHNIDVYVATVELGGIKASAIDCLGAEERPFFAANAAVIAEWEGKVTRTKAAGDTLGGIVQIEVHGMPVGLGEPVFDKLDARLAYALMGVGAVKGVEIGAGFASAGMLGSESNDSLCRLDDDTGKVCFASNNAGGVLGGISSGQTIQIQVAVKPIPSIAMPQQSISNTGKPMELSIGGRHDICAIPRIVPVLKNMVALVVADMLLLQARQIQFFGQARNLLHAENMINDVVEHTTHSDEWDE